MKKIILAIFIIILIGGAGYAAYKYLPKNITETSKPEVVTVEEIPVAKDIPLSGGVATTTTQQVPLITETPKDITPSDTPKAIAEGGVYLPYTPTAVAQATGQIVLFFWTNWSPSCQSVHQDIEKNIATLPKDVTILKVNFDDEKELRQLYDVTVQQTFVQVDNTGNMIKKWRGANTLSEIIAQIQK